MRQRSPENPQVERPRDAAYALKIPGPLLSFPRVKNNPGKSFSGKTDFPALSTYSKKIALVMVLLALAARGVAFGVTEYPTGMAIGAVAFMALNALAALYPLYLFKDKNPLNVYMMGMVARLAVIGLILIALLVRTSLSQDQLLAVTLTAMVSFVAYLGVEIQHFLRNPLIQHGRDRAVQSTASLMSQA